MNDKGGDPMFCINLMVGKGWVKCINLEVEEGLLPPQKIVVDYGNLPLRCRACYNLAHKVKNCKEI